jgi:hypothetical protein
MHAFPFEFGAAKSVLSNFEQSMSHVKVTLFQKYLDMHLQADPSADPLAKNTYAQFAWHRNPSQ